MINNLKSVGAILTKNRPFFLPGNITLTVAFGDKLEIVKDDILGLLNIF